MLTYQLRPRTLHIDGDSVPEFPSDVVVNFYFQPLQAFGDAPTGGRTVVQHSSGVKVQLNTNNGQYLVDNGGALQPLEVLAGDGSFELKGHKLTLRTHCQDHNELANLIDTRAFVLPSLLALRFGDPPFVERVDGMIGDVPFWWGLTTATAGLFITTHDTLEAAFSQALEELSLVSAEHRRRLLAALGYFHVGSRLLREAKTAGEFMSEAILNFSKVIEVLYGTKGEDVKIALKAIGYKREEIDRDFLPILDMRNSMDVGHPGLALLTVEQLETIHWFAERTETNIQEMLKRLIAAIRAGSSEVKSKTAGKPDATTLKVLTRLEALRRSTPTE